MKKTLKHTYNVLLHVFALIGFGLVGGFFAIRFHVTDVKGAVDSNAGSFSQIAAELNSQNTTNNQKTTDDLNQIIDELSKTKELRLKNICAIEAIGDYVPVNAKTILMTYDRTQSDTIVSKMIFAASLRLKEAGKGKAVEDCQLKWQNQKIDDYVELEQQYKDANGANVFPWMNDSQWQTIKAAIAKDKDKINQAGKIAGIEPRLIVASAIVEQLRLFYSERELFKKFFEPLKILGNSNKISLGVMGIKEATAIQTENNLKDSSSQYYLGPELEHALDFSSADPESERYKRLTTEGDYFYSYLYGALYMKEMMQQWKNAGYNIDYRPEIVGTLFNVGFPQSKPNPDPKVGGSQISVGDAKYSFGSLAYEFYYSGELLDEFPYIIN